MSEDIRPCKLGKDKIFEFSEIVARDLGYKPGDSLAPIVEKLGGRIHYQSLLEMDSASGSILISDIGNFEINLADHTSESRDRFTICHELGHYFLHYIFHKSNGDEIGSLKAMRYGDSFAEYEANWFAAGFLMPKEEFTSSYVKFAGDLYSLASHFFVSVQAAEVRAKSLNLLN